MDFINDFSLNRKVALHSAIYVSSILLTRVLGIVFLPILVFHLPAAEFSRYGLMVSAVNLTAYLFPLNLHVAPSRLFYDYEDSEAKSNFLFTMFAGSIFLTSLFLIGTILIIRVLRISEEITQGSLLLQLLIALFILSTVLFQFATTTMQINEKVFRYASLFSVQRIATIVFFLLAIQFTFGSYFVVVLTSVLANFLTALIGVSFFLRYVWRGKFKLNIVRESLKFSVPTVVNTSALWAIMSGGRWIGAFFISLSDLAPYMLVTQFFGVVSTITRALFDSRIPDIGRYYSSGNIQKGAKVINSTTLLSGVLTSVLYSGLFVILFGFGLRLPNGYMPTSSLLIFAFIANVLDCFYVRGYQILSAQKQTGIQASSVMRASFLSIFITILLTKAYQENGLIVAFVLSILLLALLLNIRARRSIGPHNMVGN